MSKEPTGRRCRQRRHPPSGDCSGERSTGCAPSSGRYRRRGVGARGCAGNPTRRDRVGTAASGGGWRRLVLPIATALVAAALAGLVAWTMKPDVVPRPVTRFAIALSASDEFSTAQRLATSSPCRLMDRASRTWQTDGCTFVPVDQLSGIAIAESGRSPFFSPDGQSVLWEAGNPGEFPSMAVRQSLYRPTPSIWGASRKPDDTILDGLGPDGIRRIPASGGKPAQLIKLDAGERAYGPQFLPGGRAVLFTLGQEDNRGTTRRSSFNRSTMAPGTSSSTEAPMRAFSRRVTSWTSAEEPAGAAI